MNEHQWIPCSIAIPPEGLKVLVVARGTEPSWLQGVRGQWQWVWQHGHVSAFTMSFTGRDGHVWRAIKWRPA